MWTASVSGENTTDLIFTDRWSGRLKLLSADHPAIGVYNIERVQ
jgi:hypothetical protein